jgi:hypothetical protein
MHNLPTDTQIEGHHLFSDIAELVIGVPIESLSESKQEAASAGVQKFIKDFLIVYIGDTYGKFPAVRVEFALAKDPNILDKFPETLPQIKDALLKLVESLK